MKPVKPFLFLTLILLCAVFNSADGQAVYVGFGYGGNSTGLSGMNAIVDNYNEIRPSLDKPMKQFGYLDGLSANFGIAMGGAWFDMEMAWRGQRRKASGTAPNGSVGTRYLKLKNNMFSMSVGGIGGDGNALVGGGIRADFGGLKLKTKVDFESGGEDTGWEKYNSELMLRIGPALKFVLGSYDGPAFIIGLHYGFDLFNTNLYEWDENLNNTDYPFGGPDIFNVRTNTFGFSLAFGFAGGG